MMPGPASAAGLPTAEQHWSRWHREGKNGAGNEVRTRGLDLGKVALYQLSYTRFEGSAIFQKRRGNATPL